MSDFDSLLQLPEQESFWSRFCRSPMKSVAQYVYSLSPTAVRKKTIYNPVHVVCIFDTHNTKPNLPNGDLTQSGTREELEKQIVWLDLQPYRYKIVIAGNHETLLDLTRHSHLGVKKLLLIGNRSSISKNTSTTLDVGAGHQLKVFGLPYTPKHGNRAFQNPRTDTTIWLEIPKDADLLVTYGPPKAHLVFGHLDCRVLRQALWQKEP
ncbi:hypothetical protein BDW67DRAFT_171555 [Aspergillus spinulosporus]